MTVRLPFKPGRPCIGLICSCPHLANVPILAALLEKLVESGYEVRVFAPGPPMLGEHPQAAQAVYKGNPWAFYPHGFWCWLPSWCYLKAWVLHERLHHRYHGLIVVDPAALEIMERWGLGLGIPNYYLSLELLIERDLPANAQTLRRWHQAESRLLPDFQGYIVPDAVRGATLAAEHALPREKLLCIPNSWRKIPLKPKTGILRKTFGLSASDRILIYAGNVGPGFGLEDILASVHAWPAHWHLVLHSSFGRHINPRIAFELDLIQRLAPARRVWVTNPDASPGVYWDMLADADAGLAFYTKNGDEWGWLTNNQLMGHASGKINAYLRAGLPVITNRYTNLREMLVEPMRTGLAVETALEIGPALMELDQDHDAWSRRARRAYEQFLDPESGLDKLVHLIQSQSVASPALPRRWSRKPAGFQTLPGLKFQYDPAGLALAVASILPPDPPEEPTTRGRSASPGEVNACASSIFHLRRLGLRICGTAPVQGETGGQRLLEHVLQAMHKRGKRGHRPIVVYVVPFDVVKMKTGGGRRISGIARAISSEYEVFILSLSPASRSFALEEIHPGVWMAAIPASPEFEAKVKTDIAVSADAAPLFTFANHFHLLPDYQAVLRVLAPAVHAWMLVTPAAWKPLQDWITPGAQRVVYDVHDDFLRFLQLILRCQDENCLAQAEDWERQLLARADGSIFCTRQDVSSFQARYPGLSKRFSVVPNGVDVDACDPVWPSLARARRKAAGISENLVIFAGSNYKPNQEAAEWLVRDLAPALSKSNFVVLGMDLAQYRAAGGGVPGRNVVFTGPVSERVKDAVFALADVALAPMITGTGSSLKIPDYLAHGKAVVGTPTGFRGFSEINRYPSVVMAEDIQAALSRILEDLERQPGLFDDSCRAVRSWVKDNLDWAVAIRPLAATLADPARSCGT